MIFLSFFIPPAIYLLTLAFRNRGRHPLMISGRWDFAGVVFAVSGFLLFGGPAVLHSIYHHWRLSWILGRTHLLNGVAEHWSFWVGLWILYFLAVFGGIAFMIWRRRNQTSIYNIEPAEFPPVLMRALERLGLSWSRGRHGRILLRNREDLTGTKTGRQATAIARLIAGSGNLVLSDPQKETLRSRSRRSTAGERTPALDVESFPALRHVTLRWLGDHERIRAAVEEELELELEQTPAANGPAANWFLSASLGLFLLSFLLLLLFVLSALRSAW